MPLKQLITTSLASLLDAREAAIELAGDTNPTIAAAGANLLAKVNQSMGAWVAVVQAIAGA